MLSTVSRYLLKIKFHKKTILTKLGRVKSDKAGSLTLVFMGGVGTRNILLDLLVMSKKYLTAAKNCMTR